MRELDNLRRLLEGAERGVWEATGSETLAARLLGLIDGQHWVDNGVPLTPAGRALLEALRDSERLAALAGWLDDTRAGRYAMDGLREYLEQEGQEVESSDPQALADALIAQGKEQA